MIERAYTVKEIDALRKVVQMRWLFGTTNLKNTQMSRRYKEEELQVAVEQQLRTYMLAGIVAEDIVAEDS
jgi:hypothetical protein